MEKINKERIEMGRSYYRDAIGLNAKREWNEKRAMEWRMHWHGPECKSLSLSLSLSLAFWCKPTCTIHFSYQKDRFFPLPSCSRSCFQMELIRYETRERFPWFLPNSFQKGKREKKEKEREEKNAPFYPLFLPKVFTWLLCKMKKWEENDQFFPVWFQEQITQRILKKNWGVKRREVVRREEREEK